MFIDIDVSALISWAESDSHLSLDIPASLHCWRATQTVMPSATSGDPTNVEKEAAVDVAPSNLTTHPSLAFSV